MLKPSSSCFQFLLPKARTQLAEETALIKNVMKFCWYKSLVLQWFIRKFLAKFTLQINLARFFDCFKFDLIFPLHSNLDLIFPKCSNHAIEYVYKCSGCSTSIAVLCGKMLRVNRVFGHLIIESDTDIWVIWRCIIWFFCVVIARVWAL